MNDFPAASADELAQAEFALEAERRCDAALGLFARRTSHDMSNFVTVMRTYSELLLSELPSTSTTYSDVREIHRAADSMVDYLHRIARFARSGNARPGIVAIDGVIADVMASLPEPSDDVPATSFDVQLTSAANVRMDATWLADSVRELVLNAREASPAGSTVLVRSWCTKVAEPVVDGGVPVRTGTWVIVEVVDQGNGFASEIRRDAANPFVTTKHGVRGAGFGLPLVRSAVWHAGGQIVCADGETNGARDTRVRVWLPVEG